MLRDVLYGDHEADAHTADVVLSALMDAPSFGAFAAALWHRDYAFVERVLATAASAPPTAGGAGPRSALAALHAVPQPSRQRVVADHTWRLTTLLRRSGAYVCERDGASVLPYERAHGLLPRVRDAPTRSAFLRGLSAAEAEYVMRVMHAEAALALAVATEFDSPDPAATEARARWRAQPMGRRTEVLRSMTGAAWGSPATVAEFAQDVVGAIRLLALAPAPARAAS